MIKRDDILSMAFLKKSPFTGSLKGMRYRLEQEKAESEEGKSEIFLKATVWDGPYSFEKTDEEKKVSNRFPFAEEGIREAVDWLNEKWKNEEARWKQAGNNW